MDQLVKLLRAYKESKNLEPILDSGISLDPAIIQSHILSLPAQEQEEVKTILIQLQTDLESFIQKAEVEKKSLKTQIDSNLQSSQACVSYGSAQDLGNKKKRDD